MTEMTMSEMTVPEMAVAAVMTVPTVAMTAGESLAGDGKRGSGQRQSRSGGQNRVLDRAHERLRVGQREDCSAMRQPRSAECGTM
jgi:hypothetical protein